MDPADFPNPGTFLIRTTLALGFVLGLRHALDADRLAAVSTIITEQRSLLRSSLIGVYWGVGHTAALQIFGMALAARHLLLVERVVRLAAGLFSLGFGLFLGWEVGHVQ